MAEWHDKAAHGYRTRDSPLRNNLRRGACHLGYINQCNHVHLAGVVGVEGGKGFNNTAVYDFAAFGK